MFKATRAVAEKITDDIKKYSLAISLVTQILFIAYDIYMLVTKRGFLAVNIVLLSLASVYFVFFVITSVMKKTRTTKLVKKTGARIYRCIKYAVHACTLGFAVYALYTATGGTSFIEVLLTAINAISFLAQVTVEVLRVIFDRYKDLVLSAVNSDFQIIRKLENPRALAAEILNKPLGAIAEKISERTGYATQAESAPTEETDPRLAEILAAYDERNQADKDARKQETATEKQEEIKAATDSIKNNLQKIGGGIKSWVSQKKPKKPDDEE